MYEYKKVQGILTDCLYQMYRNGRRLAHYDKEVKISVWDRKTKRTITKTDPVKDKQWLEFRALYKQIKDSGLSNPTLIVKYNKLCKEGLHSKIMENLKDYKIYLEATKKKDYALMASSYINQSRYNDKWEIVKDMSKKFINDIFKEKELNADEQDYIMSEVKNYEFKHHREVTDGVVRNMIELLLNK